MAGDQGVGKERNEGVSPLLAPPPAPTTLAVATHSLGRSPTMALVRQLLSIA